MGLLPLLASAQARHTVSGTVRDKSSGETLIGASIVFVETPNVSAISNSYGFYSISAIPGVYTMVVSFAGYGNDTLTVYLRKDTSISIGLEN
ncbi:MAG TPA: carboxypeptidase-like regulatory domain-containing protein, partial [Puia sp.]